MLSVGNESTRYKCVEDTIAGTLKCMLHKMATLTNLAFKCVDNMQIWKIMDFRLTMSFQASIVLLPNPKGHLDFLHLALEQQPSTI